MSLAPGEADGSGCLSAQVSDQGLLRLLRRDLRGDRCSPVASDLSFCWPPSAFHPRPDLPGEPVNFRIADPAEISIWSGGWRDVLRFRSLKPARLSIDGLGLTTPLADGKRWVLVVTGRRPLCSP
jgi:hypothetical protein